MSVKMVTFKTVFDKYSELGKARNERSGHKESQIRDKLMEIVDAVGIEANLLRAGKNFNSPLEIPETSVRFCVDVIDWHTSTEAKALRKAAFLEVSAEKKIWLIDGFSDFLKMRGYDAKTIEQQRRRMEYRMNCSLQKNLAILQKNLEAIYSSVLNLRQSIASHFLYEDQVLFADFAAKKVTELANYLDEVADYLDDGRGEEIYDSAMAELNNSNSAEIMERELRQEQVFQAISQDERYQKLTKERNELLEQEDFIKNKKGRYQQIVDEMQKIADGYEKKIFGDIMPAEPEIHFVMNHPITALADAIAYKKEADEERKQIMARPPISEEEQEVMRKILAEHNF